MITKTVGIDISIYSDIFADIKKNTGIEIQKLEDLFGQLNTIATQYFAEENNWDPKFLKLPAEEPTFNIDANSRKIEIPGEFKSNGLSVQGDNLAETVFFKIARYFDYMDLSTCDISINWKMGTETGKTKNFILSTNIEPGYIIFGWPVDSTITKKNGSLSFAVEFSKTGKDENNEEIKTYSFNTLAATINIKEGLIVNDAEVTNLKPNILKILANSQFGEGDAAVGELKWFDAETNLGTEVDNNNFIIDGTQHTYNLATVVSDDGIASSTAVTFYANAYVDGVTQIDYTNDAGEKINEYVSAQHFTLVKDDEGTLNENGDTWDEGDGDKFKRESALNDDIVYYVKESDGTAYNPASSDDLANLDTNLYIRYGAIDVNTAGTYFVKAQGQKFSDNKLIGNSAIISSGNIVIPAAQAPESVELTGESALDITNLPIEYSIDSEEAANVVFVDEPFLQKVNGEGEEGVQYYNAEGEAWVEGDKYEYIIAKLTATASFANQGDYGALSFVVNKEKNTPEFYKNYTADNNNNYVETFNVTEADMAENNSYKVTVVNYKNGTESDKKDSNDLIISQLATPITNATLQFARGMSSTQWSDVTTANIRAADQNQVIKLQVSSVTLAGNNSADLNNLSYEWQKSDKENEGYEPIPNATKSSFSVMGEEAYYQVVIKNKLNGSVFNYPVGKILVSY